MKYIMLLVLLGKEGARDDAALIVIGWIMVSVDIFCLVASLVALFAMLASFRTHVKKLKDRPDGIVVIPSTALQHRSRVNASRPRPTRKLTASMVEKAVTNNKVKVFEMRHEDQHRKSIEGILSRQEIFRRKLALKLDKRTKTKVPST